MTQGKGFNRQWLLVILCGLLAGCSGHRAAEHASPSSPLAAQSAPATYAPTENAAVPPLYPGARVDTSQGVNGVLEAPTLRMITRYYKTSDSWDVVSHWYLAHAKGWKSYSKPGGGDLTLARAKPSPVTIMVSGDRSGTEILIELFRTKT